MAESFVHLHTHSEYSLLDGLGRIKNLVSEAKKLGQPALALTDHGVMHGAVEFFRAAKYAEIKPIIGVESYQTVWGRPMGGRDAQFDRENYHLLMLAKNMTGYRNLLRICSNSHLNGYYYRPRVDHEFLGAHAEGIIATTGCMGAEVPQLIHQGKEQEAYDRLGWYVDVFGKENFFIELQEHSIPDLIPINKTLVPWAEKFGIQLLATNDVHYVREQDGGPHDVLLCVQTGVTVQTKERMRMSDGSYFLKSREQMEATFRPYIDLPASAFDNSLRIAEMCDVDLEDGSYHLPDIPIPDGFTYESYIRHLTELGLERLYGEARHSDVVIERKERELSIIHQMGFDIYFLIVADLCNFARTRGIWWNVRGSGAGSLVAYCIGITGIDPLKNNLIFERFLNPGRVSMPDFDLDFPDDQREEMIRYTLNKFGEDQVAQIATFGRMKARAAVRDVGRAKGVDLSNVDRLAKLIPAIPGKPVTIQDCLTEGHEFYSPDLVQYYEKEAWARDLLDTSMQLEGVARHSSVHAAAVIVADRELTHYTPLMRGNKNTITSTITQYEFPILESIGLLKVDFLGLSTLSVMREASRLIRERHNKEYTLSNIPIEGDESVEAFKLLSSGEVSGVFQVEGQGMRRVLTEMRPTTFEHIVATISLYRPGPLEYIPAFIKRLHGEEEVEYKHPSLQNILGETYGICVSGDSIVLDAHTGERRRLDSLKDVDEFHIQGVDENWRPAIGRVTHWIDSGFKEVYKVTLQNGASIKVTGDHRMLTESGWQPLKQLRVGDRLGTPPRLLGPDEYEPHNLVNHSFHQSANAVTAKTSHSLGVEMMIATLPLHTDARELNVNWQEIIAIEPAGIEHVYDLTVEGLHSFVANNVIVHNCVYQEQIIQILSQLAGYTPGDADLVRRAVSKKKASDIEKHKKIFVEGCSRNGIPKDAAEAIYGDIEFFARYGFNKSHAADYAVICVQTAFLKANYPVEYMAALLLIERDKTEKVINFINECRRMGIDVLPPDVNYSGLDFEIQTRPPEAEQNSRRDGHLAYNFPVPEGSAIRFGMAAVKNVGEGPVKVILDARAEGGPFESLEDFCERVDLRQVNKRALECLIKVGAFDRFGKRSQMIEVLDQMVAQSASVFAARDSGQLSMFDLMSDMLGGGATSVSPIALPNIEEVKGRDRLQWEKELLGVYAMSHPLQAMSVNVSSIVTCGCSELDENYDGKNVLLIGMIASVRTINTKKGDQMAFVQLEDMGGQGEVVVFPRTYAEVKEMLIPDSIVMVKGKAQTRDGQTTLLADSFQNYVDQIMSVGPEPQYQKPLLDVVPTFNGMRWEESRMNDDNESSTNDSGVVTSSSGFSGIEPFGGDDDDAPFMEENPFANEPPAWVATDAVSKSVPAKAAMKPPASGPSISGPRSADGKEEAAPDNPYLHESRNLREEDGDFEIPLPKSLQGESALLTEPNVTDQEEIEAERAEPQVIEVAVEEPVSQRTVEEAAPANPYLHESRNLREEDDDIEIPLPQSLRDDPPVILQPTAQGGGDGKESKKDEAKESKPAKSPANENKGSNGHNGQNGNGHNGNGASNGHNVNGALLVNGKRTLQILFRPSGDVGRDKYRLQQIVETVRDPKGRDQFCIVIKSNGKNTTLAFPDDPCSISERLRNDLSKYFRVDVQVKE